LLGREVVSKAKTPLREPWSLAGVGLGDVEESGCSARVVVALANLARSGIALASAEPRTARFRVLGVALGREARTLPALLVERLGLRLVEDDVRGPATLIELAEVARAVESIAIDADRVAAAVCADVRTATRLRRFDPAPVDVERPRAPREHVGGDGADEGLACDDDGLEGGLSRRP